MTRFKLDRRTVIKGAGTIAIALPWLEVMGRGRQAQAQTSSVPLKRFVTWYQPDGGLGPVYLPLVGSPLLGIVGDSSCWLDERTYQRPDNYCTAGAVEGTF